MHKVFKFFTKLGCNVEWHNYYFKISHEHCNHSIEDLIKGSQSNVICTKFKNYKFIHLQEKTIKTFQVPIWYNI